MPVSVRFKLKTGSEPKLLQFRLTVNGKESSGVGVITQNGNYVKLYEREWNQTEQRVRGNSDDASTVNKTIAAIRARLFAIQEAQMTRHDNEQGPTPTTESVLYAYRNGSDPWVVIDEYVGVSGREFRKVWTYEKPDVLDIGLSPDTDIKQAFAAYLLDIRVNGKISRSGKLEKVSPVVLARYDRAYDLLRAFQSKDYPVKLITPGWADRFHSWLQTQEEGLSRANRTKISAPYASRIVKRVNEVMRWLHRTQEVIPFNPLHGILWTSYSEPEIHCLTLDELETLETLELSPKLDLARWWFLLMSYTSLGYREAQQYARNRSAFEVETPDGVLIQGKRIKSNVAFCIPKIRKVDALFNQHPEGPKAISPQKLNDLLRDTIAPLIGYEYHLSIKVARKTAGHWFLEQNFAIAEVSRVLGHKTIATTEKHYARSTDRMIRNAMRRTGIAE